jgi:serine/threonine protein kinase
VLLGSVAYDFGVDVWAAGCVMAELIELSPLVPGTSDLEQIFRVLKARGTPSVEEWPGLADLPDASKLVLPALPKPPLAALLPNASPSALDLLDGLLAYNPDKRLSAAEVRAPLAALAPSGGP